MTKLSVNVNKWATLRNARGGNNPDVVETAKACIRFGADGITVHPRQDERHIRRKDVFDIAGAIDVEFNIEGYPSESFLKLVEEVKPAQVTLVPDPPDVLTSNAGWDTITHKNYLKEIISRLRENKIRVSLFSWTDLKLIEGAKETGADRIELYTEGYAKEYKEDKAKAIARYVTAALKAKELGLGLNAGHDLDLHNLEYFHENIPGLLEVSIGHALICDAIGYGLETTIKKYQACLGKKL